MHVVFIADVPAAEPISGAEQVLYQQARALAAAKGFRVTAITRRNTPPAEEEREVDGVKEGLYYANTGNARQFFAALWKYPRRFFDQFRREGNFNVAVSHQPFTCLALLVSGRLKNIPFIYVFHSPSHEEYLLMHPGDGLASRLQAFARRLVEGYCLRRAARVMTLSGFMAEKVTDIHRIPQERIRINPGGVDLQRFAPLQNRAKIKTQLGLPDDKVHFLTIRNLEPRMGVDNLVRCFHRLKMQGIPVHLTIGGSGVDHPKIVDLISSLQLDKEVTMTGFIPAEHLAQYYGAADYFVIPTRCLEGFGLVTPESLAAGTPVLGTPVGGTKEILSNFDDRFLFQDTSPEAMAEGIRQALRHPPGTPEYDTLRTECRAFVEKNYSWRKHTDRLLELIEDLQT